MTDRPVLGSLEQRDAPFTDNAPTIEGQRLRGVIPYNVESREMPGGWREVIDPGALRNADLSELRATVDHGGVPLGRYSANTLQVEDGPNAFAWAVELAESRADVRDAVQRGDIVAGSWRMVVGKERWQGNVRHVQEIRALRDVSVAGASDPVYPSAAVEYRTDVNPAPSDPAPRPGNLRVEDRTGSSQPRRNLADEFRSARNSLGGTGIPVDHPGAWRITLPSWEEYECRARTGRYESEEDRAITWSGTLPLLNQISRQGVPLPYDPRWAYPAFGSVGVDAAATEVRVFQETARSLATPTNMTRAIDSVVTKPETGSTINLASVPLQQVANKQSGIPSIYLLQPNFPDIVNGDLRLAFNDAVDALLLATLTSSGFQAPGTDNLYASIRKAKTTLLNAGYAPNTVILTPAASETLDLMVSGITGGTADFVNAPGQGAPSDIFGMAWRISKSIPAPVVVDSNAYGKLYMGPVSLGRFEENFGQTNSSTVRLETLNAAFGVERQSAAVRIAAS